MTENGLICDTVAFVEDFFGDKGDGHDAGHTLRVYRTALMLAEDEPECDVEVVALAALLHDVDDYKLNKGVQSSNAAGWLAAQAYSPQKTEAVLKIIDEVSFRGAGVDDACSTLEGAVVQDADRLDAIGCVGIIRTFVYGASRGRPMYDKEIPPRLHDSFEAYKAGSAGGTSVNHFYEKLFLLKDRMKTAAGRKLAEERDGFMREFVERLTRELAP